MNKCRICGKSIPKKEKVCSFCLKFLESIESESKEDDSIVIVEVEESGKTRAFMITEEQLRENNGKNVLDSRNVLIIIKKELKKVYIWIGLKSTSYQQERAYLVARFPILGSYGSKIVSVYEEPTEFLENFGLESGEVLERLAPISIKGKDTNNDEGGGDFPFPYIYKPPSPPEDLGLAGQPQARESIIKQVLEDEPYCKHCGAELPKGQTICHVCGKKVG